MVGLHAALFYVLIATGLSGQYHKWVAPPFVVKTLDRPPPVVVPTLPKTDLNWHTTIELPRLTELVVAKAPDTLAGAGEDPPLRFEPPPPPPPREVNRLVGGPGAGFPNPDAYYPSAAKRLEEQGVTTVRVCVDTRGELTSEPTGALSSGSTRLDAAALKLARAGSGRYRPSTEDGRPVDSCYLFRVRFQIRN